MYYVYVITKDGEYVQSFKEIIAAQMYALAEQKSGNETRVTTGTR